MEPAGNHGREADTPPDGLSDGMRKKFAVGYFFPKPGGAFSEVVAPFLDYIAEVYYPWPGLLSARRLQGSAETLRTPLTASLRWCRLNRIPLDMLLNATCYGDDSATMKQYADIIGELRNMEELELLPDIVTTTSPFIAAAIRREYPRIELRASVNMRLGSTAALEYLGDMFDSFYICRDLQRDIDTVKLFAGWAASHHKKMCMLANSGCLRNCPWQVFHETLLSHDFAAAVRECDALGMPSVLCAEIYRRRMYEEILRATWIRPEDLRRYAPYVSIIKLSTRNARLDQRKILSAYTSGSYEGDLLEIIDPSFPPQLRGFMIDNSAFPPQWSEGAVAGRCASDCAHCGKCGDVLKKVLKPIPQSAPPGAAGLCFTVKR